MKKLKDYGNYYESSDDYEASTFKELEEVQEKIRQAYHSNSAIRVRGMGHSMNGSSLPKKNEYLIKTSSCNHYKFENDTSVTVGSGAAVWDVNNMLKKYGYELYVVNDGGAAASSIGGYLSAGGIGEHCYLYGGFWETVEKVKLIDGRGEVVESSYGDELFQWLFGAMGQLGFIYEVTLKIKPITKEKSNSLAGIKGNVLASNLVWPKQLWYNVFTTKEYAVEAQKELVLLSKIHRHVWAARPVYYYDLAFKRFNPPLIHPEQKDLVAVGVWGDAWNDKEFNMYAVKLLEKDFSELIDSNKNFRRYIQTELTFENFNYETYFGEEVFSGFKKMKLKMDPKGIFGKGIF